jgi:hypothetical protein
MPLSAMAHRSVSEIGDGKPLVLMVHKLSHSITGLVNAIISPFEAGTLETNSP